MTVILPLIVAFNFKMVFHFTWILFWLHCGGRRLLWSECVVKWRHSNHPAISQSWRSLYQVGLPDVTVCMSVFCSRNSWVVVQKWSIKSPTLLFSFLTWVEVSYQHAGGSSHISRSQVRFPNHCASSFCWRWFVSSSSLQHWLVNNIISLYLLRTQYIAFFFQLSSLYKS